MDSFAFYGPTEGRGFIGKSALSEISRRDLVLRAPTPIGATCHEFHFCLVVKNFAFRAKSIKTIDRKPEANVSSKTGLSLVQRPVVAAGLGQRLIKTKNHFTL